VHCCYRDAGSTAARIKGTFRQLKLVTSSRLCVVDGYTPAVSVPTLGRDTIVIQLWHALGAIKRFGWQAIDTPAGRTGVQARGLRMHRNYTEIIAGGKGAIADFAQAFACPQNRVAALGLPRMDYLLDELLARRRRDAAAAIRAQCPALGAGRLNILFAPTFRRGELRDEIERHAGELAECFSVEKGNVIVTFHPFSGAEGEVVSGADAGGKQRLIHIPHVKGIDLLELADYVITDYSAIAFEAALLRKKVLFYVPDIEAYRLSPGLNIDPEELFPRITFRDVASLVEFLHRDGHSEDYADSGFWRYCDSYLVQPAVGATERLAAHLVRMIA
jgi:CDP-ribitol ribitolphosphotransferase